MDIWILFTLLIIATLIALLGIKYKVMYLTIITGLMLMIMSYPVLTEGITYNLIDNETTNYIYGNQTNYYTVLNETRNMTSLPFLFNTTYTPLVYNSEDCYYPNNGTEIASVVSNSLLGTINITG